MTSKRLVVNLPNCDKKSVNAGLPDTKVSVVYPSEWFRTNEGKKPIVRVYRATATELYCALYPQIKAEKWDDALVTSFLVATLTERTDLFKVESDEQWVSFKHQLAGGGQVGVADLLTLEELESKPPAPGPAKPTPAEEISFFCALLTIYRRVQAKENPAVKAADLTDKFKSVLGKEPYNMSDDDARLMVPIAGTANLTSGFMRVLAVIDMFFVKFPQAPGSAVRIATFTLRYRGCTAITALTHACITLGLDAYDLASLIVPQAPADDAVRVYEDGQEHDDPYGYFPYHFVMGLSNHSPYSLAAAPSLTFYTRCLAAFGGSKNAAYTYTAAGIRNVPELIETAYLLIKKIRRLEPGDLRFAEASAMDKWKAHKEARDTLLKDDDDDEVQLHEGAQERGLMASLLALPTRQDLTPLHRRLDEALAELSVYHGLSRKNAMGLYHAAQCFKGADVGTVGHTIYDQYGRVPPYVE
ncbi:nucleoprotein [Connecticut virus]|uniref:Nucleoprotein n=1 Tax=Connecticut virus TaxID=1272962 RepID=A0A0D3R1R1_9RHAB|nr:nucleoprotein [Connecticut virus]AJR28561.1 nucleoprotein [Connecticut virus]